MSLTPLLEMPATIAAGTTVKLLRRFTDHPADDSWTYTLHLRGISVLNVNGSASGDAFEVTLSAANTAGLTAGVYRWTERLAKSGDVYTGDSGVVSVTLDLATATAGQGQTHEEKTLALIEAAIEGRIPNGMEKYQVQGRVIEKIPLEELVRLRGVYAAKVWRQRNPGKLLPSAQVVFRAP